MKQIIDKLKAMKANESAVINGRYVIRHSVRKWGIGGAIYKDVISAATYLVTGKESIPSYERRC